MNNKIFQICARLDEPILNYFKNMLRHFNKGDYSIFKKID